MPSKAKFALATGIVVLFLFMISFYTVRQDQRALVLRLGKLKATSPEQVYIAKPGLHIKIPLIDRILRFDIKIQNLDIKSSPIVTAEKKRVIADYFVKWKISKLDKFYKSTAGEPLRADTLLRQQLNDALRAEFGRRTIREVVSDDRESIMMALNEKANESAKNLGLDIVDVRIKGIDLPDEVSEAVFARMRAEREKVATELRSKGQAEGEAIRAQADSEATVIVATAQKQANNVRAMGDKQAAKIYADAYDQDPDFYAFYRSLLAYQNTFSNKQDIVLVTPQSQFFGYFNSATGMGIPHRKEKE